jgi:PAS domain S-box-containing protein
VRWRTEPRKPQRAALSRIGRPSVLGRIYPAGEMNGPKLTEAQLRESEERLQAAIAGGDLGTWDLDLVTGKAAHSPRHDQIWGYASPQPEWGLEIAMRHVLPEDRSLITAAFDRAMKSGVLAHENRITWPDGTIHWIAAHGRVRYDGEGRPVRVTGVVADITERKRVEEALRASEERFRVLADAMPQLAWIADADGGIYWYNRRWYEYTGTSAEEMAGWGWQRVHDATALPAVLERWTAAIASAQPFEMSFPLRGADGVFRDFLTQALPVRDEDGRVLQWVGTNTDITRVREAEAILRESAERVRLATAATGVGIWEWDVATDQLQWDLEMFRIYGIPPAPGGVVPYSTWSDAVLPEDLAAQEAALRDKIPMGAQGRLEFRIRRRDTGEIRHIQGVETRRVNEQGEVQAFVGTNLDVTEQKLAEDRLRQLAEELSEADRRKNEFLSTLAHELRNPLAPLRNGLGLMKLARVDPEAEVGDIEQIHDMMERQMAQLVRLVDDLMDVSRISTGKMKLKREPVALASVINSAVESSRAILDQMAQELAVTLPREPVYIDADSTRMAQVFLNLLHNASKYSARGARISLAGAREDGEAVVRVTDPGIGIPPDMLDSIFDIFTQVDRTLEKSHGGLGIGLSLVQRIVRLHGGSVEARSKGPGQGSEFIVRLPAVASPDTANTATQEDRLAATGNRCRVLVADDNEDAAVSLTTLLGLLGHDVRTAFDGLEAIDVAAAFRPHVVMLDIGMPKLNGYDACRRMRATSWGETALMIAVTGWGQDEDKRRSQAAGFDHHLVKPVESRVIMDLVASCKPERAQHGR